MLQLHYSPFVQVLVHAPCDHADELVSGRMYVPIDNSPTAMLIKMLIKVICPSSPVHHANRLVVLPGCLLDHCSQWFPSAISVFEIPAGGTSVAIVPVVILRMADVRLPFVSGVHRSDMTGKEKEICSMTTRKARFSTRYSPLKGT